jgi:excisionase family DNA binding protein
MEQGDSGKSDGPAPIERLAYSTREAAEAAGVSEATIYRAIARRKLRASKFIRHKRILRTELERWLRGEEVNPPKALSET